MKTDIKRQQDVLAELGAVRAKPEAAPKRQSASSSAGVHGVTDHLTVA